MLKSYEAIYDHGRIQWLGEKPRLKKARVVLVVDDIDELEDIQETHFIQPRDAEKDAVDELLADSFGAWGRHSVTDVTAMIEARRHHDWGDR